MARTMLLPSGMTHLTVERLMSILPRLDELQPLMDHLLAASEADPAKVWDGSGELGTTADRLVATSELADVAEDLARREGQHRVRIYREAAGAVEALAGGDGKTAAEHLLRAAEAEEGRQDPARAGEYADAAYRILRETGEAGLISLALRRRARHRRTVGRYEDAIRDYEEAFLAAEAAGDIRGAAEASIGAGNVLEEKGAWTEAARRYRQALDILDALGEATPERWHALLNLHVVLRSAGDLDAAVGYLEEADAVARALEDDDAVPFTENARGQLRMVRGDFSAAAEHLNRALDASAGARAETTIRLNLAETLFAMGRTLDAAEEARRAERQAIISSLPQKLPEVYRLLGRIAAGEGVADAFVLFERALQIIRERKLPEIERAQTLQAYAEAEADVGDPDTAETLMMQADDLYEKLGIEHHRAAWADRFGDGAQVIDPHNEGTRDA